MSILSQIIAYSPNKIDTETKARSLVQGPRNMYAGGQLVQPNVDGSRPGYAGSLRIEPNITKTKAGNYEVIYKNKQIGTFNKISDARNARETAITKDPGKLRTEKKSTIVVEEKEQVIGIITQKDILKRIAFTSNDLTKVSEVMTSPVKFVYEDDLEMYTYI